MGNVGRARCPQRAGVRRSINLRVVITFVSRRAKDSTPYLIGKAFRQTL